MSSSLTVTYIEFVIKNLPRTYIHTRNFPWIFIASLSITAKTWKQQRRPAVSE